MWGDQKGGSNKPETERKRGMTYIGQAGWSLGLPSGKKIHGRGGSRAETATRIANIRQKVSFPAEGHIPLMKKKKV